MAHPSKFGEVLHYIYMLTEESDIKFNNANGETCKYIISRIKIALNSLDVIPMSRERNVFNG